MTLPTIISDREQQRMAAVRRYDILDTPPDGAFDRITAMAARRFGVPIAIISIVDEHRIWFKSHHGLAAGQIGRAPGLCSSAILSDNPHILTDASIDPRSLANPLVAGEFGLRFYAGIPLVTRDGHNLGTLCVIDTEPRPINQAQIDDLKDHAAIVMDQLELRLAANRALAQARLMAMEIDHRVMNSLQFVSGLLAMQSRAPDLGDPAAQLQMAANRVAAVAQVHRNFYSDESSQTSCVAFLRRLCVDLSNILGRPIEVKGDETDVPTSWIQPIGLLINELVTNAAKHGSGTIDVSYSVDGGLHKLVVCDQGMGLPAEFSFQGSSSQSLGMKVISSLAMQLGGRVTADSRAEGPGACFTVSIPAGVGAMQIVA